MKKPIMTKKAVACITLVTPPNGNDLDNGNGNNNNG
jgi:hypothetical protein